MSKTATAKDAGKLLTVPKAARLLGIDVKTLRVAIGLGQVKAVRISTVVKVPTAEVERLLSSAAK